MLSICSDVIKIIVNLMTDEEKSAIIGYWRSCQDIDMICNITGLPFWVVHNVIEIYKTELLTKQIKVQHD